MNKRNENFKLSLLAGGIAGFSVDTILYPLDTIKTRLQSQQGFIKAGGFKNVYKGITPVICTSAPGAAIFFSTYTLTKKLCNHLNLLSLPSHITAASIGEIMACTLRVPTEVVKQRRMVSKNNTPITIIKNTYKLEGIRGFYRGYMTTILREMPFAVIQYPLWEFCKSKWASHQNNTLHPWQSALCGCFAGAIAAFFTTPIDVAKTRIMLAEKSCELSKGNLLYTLKHLYNEEGVSQLFRGCVPRTIFISIGGAIFLGAYDKAYMHLNNFKMLQGSYSVI